MRIAFYAHGGSGNHGCEAIVRSTIQALGEHHDYTVVSERPKEDIYYKLNQLVRVVPSKEELPSGLRLLLYKTRMRISSNDTRYYKYRYRSLIERTGPVDLALAIGGDNYCYSGFLERFSVMNSMFIKRNIPIALWGCSIDPERITTKMLSDLKRYSFITARESITFQALRDSGLPNVYLIPDTAFKLPSNYLPLPENFIEGNTVGINLSPLIIAHEQIGGIVLRNVEVLIEYILENTSMNIALIPHVVWKRNDDRASLSELYERYSYTHRISMINDCSATVLKGYISRCRFLIAARTHASIAGYSTLVPTLVLGYSVKSRGIAQDLFETYNNFVLPIETIHDSQTILNSFIWMLQREKEIKTKLSQKIDEYFSAINNVNSIINHWLNNDSNS